MARKEYLNAIGDIEIKLMELNAYPPLREFGQEIRVNLSVLKKMTAAQGPGLGIMTGLASGSGLGDTKDHCNLAINQEDFHRHLLAALVTAHGQGLGAKGPGLARLPCSQDRCPTFKDLPDNIRTLARDLHRAYQVRHHHKFSYPSISSYHKACSV